MVQQLLETNMKPQVGSLVDYNPDEHGPVDDLVFFESWGDEGDLFYGSGGLFLIKDDNIKVYVGIAY